LNLVNRSIIKRQKLENFEHETAMEGFIVYNNTQELGPENEREQKFIVIFGFWHSVSIYSWDSFKLLYHIPKDEHFYTLYPNNHWLNG